ncbi:MAG: 2-dehydro-3-deoxygalactonokinase [Comamonadaceae bacterium]|nr:MAG: 2-dehydro-3-deoxygalactonokinase [Comamonadaceae bacterium]
MHLIAVDWGTTSLRGALLDRAGTVLATQSHPRGILSVPAGGFEAVFASLFGDWMALPGARGLISGMAGSQQGWVEAPYCACPAGVAEVASRIVAIDGIGPSGGTHDIAIVPGLRDEHDGVPDVMRGEEVQILGAMASIGARDGLFVLPGTHSKWATVQDGRVTGFRTFMTGEFYALLSQHSILARTLEADAPLDEAAFRDGVARSTHGAGLLHNAFGTRTLALFERLPKAARSSYLSGLLIGEELRTQPLQGLRDVVLVGAPALTERYALALASVDAARPIHTRTLGAEATWAGLHALAMIRQPFTP